MNMDPLQITFTKLVCYTVKTLPNGIFTILELDSYYPPLDVKTGITVLQTSLEKCP